MRKALFFCLLITLFGLNQTSFAQNEAESPTPEAASTSQKDTSKASIGFSTKTIKQEEEEKKIFSKGRLPTTGEAAGMGLSLLGLIILIVIFRKELKEM